MYIYFFPTQNNLVADAVAVEPPPQEMAILAAEVAAEEEEEMVVAAAEEVAAEEVDAAVGEEKLPEDVGEELTGAVEEGTSKFIYFLLF